MMMLTMAATPGFLFSQEAIEDESDASEKIVTVNEVPAFELDYGVDAYYSSIGVIYNIARTPIPDYSDRSESEVYANLLGQSLLPRFVLLEASVNPMPLAGVAVRRWAPRTYEAANISDSLNVVKAVTFGFEEPYAVSLFLGNLARFSDPNEDSLLQGLAHNMAYVGLLISVGNYHIKDNQLVDDWWTEVEWKIKGDRNFKFSNNSWSFRIGAKLHANPDIADVVYIGLRRDRVDFLESGWSIWHNSGFEYRYDMRLTNLAWMRHYFQVDKKWPFGETHTAFKLILGFIYESESKYSGVLDDRIGSENLQFILQPNIEF